MPPPRRRKGGKSSGGGGGGQQPEEPRVESDSPPPLALLLGGVACIAAGIGGVVATQGLYALAQLAEGGSMEAARWVAARWQKNSAPQLSEQRPDDFDPVKVAKSLDLQQLMDDIVAADPKAHYVSYDPPILVSI